MQANKIKQYITQNDDGSVNFEINVSDRDITVAGVKVETIGMYVAADEDEGDGDLYVAWDDEGLDEDAIEAAIDAFYSEDAFDAQLHMILEDCGFSKQAATSVRGSESGMQDEGRASYDAYCIAEEVRAALAA
jgi:hypothetical protein